MTDLDALAMAVRSKPRRRRPAARSWRIGWIALVLIAAASIAVILPILLVAGHSIIHHDPQFIVAREFYSGSFWKITNTGESDLVVEDAKFNGDFRPRPLGRLLLQAFSGNDLAANGGTFPVRVSVGGSFVLLQWTWGAFDYQKDIVFIDFDTNRGRFRYRIDAVDHDHDGIVGHFE